MSPTPRAAWALAALALGALLLPLPLMALAALALLATTIVDARAARTAPAVTRRLPFVLARGVATAVAVEPETVPAGRVRFRQATPPDLKLDPGEADGRLDSTLTPLRRGRHALPAVAARLEGPLGLGAWTHRCGRDTEVLVYPDLPAARALALSVRRGRFREQGRLARGPLGLGTDFESVRDYLPDDDIRQLNWRATARLGRPMSNQYRIEQDREVTCVLDTGRLMAAPLADRTRLDAAVDAAVAVATVADELGDRSGALAFDSEVRRLVRPRRGGAHALVRSLFDLESRPVESDYELAFRTVEGTKRGLIIVFTDLLDEAAAGALIEAVPVLARRHAVVIAGATDEDLEMAVGTPPSTPSDVYAAAAALDVLSARARIAARLSRTGAGLVEEPPSRLAAACVRAYLEAKARSRL